MLRPDASRSTATSRDASADAGKRAALQAENERLRRELASLARESGERIHALWRRCCRLREAEQQLRAIVAHPLWPLAGRLAAAARRLAPPGSRRAKLAARLLRPRRPSPDLVRELLEAAPGAGLVVVHRPGPGGDAPLVSELAEAGEVVVRIGAGAPAAPVRDGERSWRCGSLRPLRAPGALVVVDRPARLPGRVLTRGTVVYDCPTDARGALHERLLRRATVVCARGRAACDALRARRADVLEHDGSRASLERILLAATAPDGVPLRQVRERCVAAGSTIVFAPTVAWDSGLVQRPQHLARHFARAGRVVVFDVTGLPGGETLRGFRAVEPDLFLYAGPAAILHQLPDVVLWTTCYNHHLRDGFPPGTRVVYDLIDEFEVHDAELGLMRRNHARAVADADLLCIVAESLRRHFPAGAELLRLPNGVDHELFAAPAELPADPELGAVLARGAPVLGYYGALADWFDHELLQAVAAARPDWSFVLIGPDYDGSLAGTPLLRLPNVTWLGPRRYVELPGYLRAFDVAAIPFRVDALTAAISPLKLYEYLASGTPVVATALPECRALPELHIVESAADFAAALDPALAESRDAAARRRLQRLAEGHSWRARVAAVDARLAAARGARADGGPA